MQSFIVIEGISIYKVTKHKNHYQELIRDFLRNTYTIPSKKAIA